MEENRLIARVGNYSTRQAYPSDCTNCHDAKYATVIIDSLCLDCFVNAKIKVFLNDAQKALED